MNLLNNLAHITTFVFDVDGVMTDGSLLIMPGGEYLRTMNIKDGYALQLAVKKGYRVIVITGSFSEPVAERLAYLGVKDVHQRTGNKKAKLLQLMEAYGLERQEVLFMGDDIPDLEVMQAVGVAACPADAVAEILQVSQFISSKAGGRGCVRDVIETVLRLRNHWTGDGHTASL